MRSVVLQTSLRSTTGYVRRAQPIEEENEMHWPQITYLVLLSLSLGISMSEHDKPRKGKENFPLRAVMGAFVVWLLFKGGFFG